MPAILRHAFLWLSLLGSAAGAQSVDPSAPPDVSESGDNGGGSPDISVSADWAKTVTRRDLVAGAGSNLGPIESRTGVATLRIRNTRGRDWAVRVNISDVNWPSGAVVSIRRSSNERGVTGGTSYLPLRTASQLFIRGSGDRSVEIQLRVDGLTVKTAPDVRSIRIRYAVDRI